MTTRRPHTFLVIEGGKLQLFTSKTAEERQLALMHEQQNATAHGRLFHASLVQQMEAMERSGIFPKQTIILLAETAIDNYRKGSPT